MINGFDEETAPLNEKELKVLPFVVSILEERKGVEWAITNKEIVKKIWNTLYTKIGEARIRKIINHIRDTGLVSCLIATSKGYYVAKTEQELLDYEESLYGRAMAILNVKARIKQQREERFRNKQGVLF